MPVKVIAIGDPHFKIDNIPEVDTFIERVEALCFEKKPDFIVCLGDLLHTHEKLHTTPLNKAYEFIERMRNISPTYILVGNHDFCNNSQFLTDNHWMNGMKEWNDVTVVDKVIARMIDNEKFVFTPYVFPGRLEEALDTLDDDWKDATCIFAHQEFKGCKMGAIVSDSGDDWPLTHPHVISGHIHARQIIQENVYYTGSAMQHAFGESDKNIIAVLDFDFGEYSREEVDLELPRKKIVYMDVDNVEDYQTPATTEDQIKITISGSYNEFKTFKKSKKYKELTAKGIKVVFKQKKIEVKKAKDEIDQMIEQTSGEGNTEMSFVSILEKLVENQKNPLLHQAYEYIIHDREVSPEDVMFL